MLERLADRIAAAWKARVSARLPAIETHLRSEMPPGLDCGADDERVAISGRGLRRRYIVDGELRSIIARAR